MWTGSNRGSVVRVIFKVGLIQRLTKWNSVEGPAIWRFWPCCGMLQRTLQMDMKRNKCKRLLFCFFHHAEVVGMCEWGCARTSHANLHQALWSISANPDLNRMWNTFWSFWNLNLCVSSSMIMRFSGSSHLCPYWSHRMTSDTSFPAESACAFLNASDMWSEDHFCGRQTRVISKHGNI